MQRFAELRLPTEPQRVQARNKTTWNENRSLSGSDFFTLGYVGRTIDQVLCALKAARVATLVDIRFNPVSMYRPEFSKQNLRQLCETNGIAYVHMPKLGVPRDVRGRAIGKPDRNDIWVWYDALVNKVLGRNLHSFFNGLEHPVAFLCAELDPTACHRHRLAMFLERQRLRGFDL